MKVYIEQIEDYSPEQLYQYFSNVFQEERLGEILASKNSVLLKPNLLGTHTPEVAVTTHPVVIESLVRVLKVNGISNIFLGDSPGGTFRTENVWQITGMKEVATKLDIKLINFGTEGIEKITTGDFELMIDKQVLQFPAIINIAKYKTHSLTMFTGAVKNLFGSVPGLIKSDYHRLYPDSEKFAELLVAIYQVLKEQVVLNVIDGIWGMEGEGPSAGIPRNFGVMLASRSASALDFTAAKMMSFRSERIPTVRMSMEADNLSPEDIVLDEKWQEFQFPKVRLGRVSLYSSFMKKVPESIQKLFNRLYNYYPAFNKNCRLCRICVDSCPVKAITLEKEDLTPEIDYQTCIKCMCCHEFCPHNAVYIKKTLLAKILLK
ncbi:MAG: DUF362 domain-containing protein [Candidatus Cloacimonetes bacterium]|nr:DUF362 domain-containing protein [Candidatus Cloacimonadota bacterium]